MDIATKLTDLTTDLRACRQAITEKGGEISATAGFAEVAEKILDISTGSNIGTVIDDTSSLMKQVPINSVNHCISVFQFAFTPQMVFANGSLPVFTLVVNGRSFMCMMVPPMVKSLLNSYSICAPNSDLRCIENSA